MSKYRVTVSQLRHYNILLVWAYRIYAFFMRFGEGAANSTLKPKSIVGNVSSGFSLASGRGPIDHANYLSLAL